MKYRDMKFMVGGYKVPRLLEVTGLKFNTSVGTVAITDDGEFRLADDGVVLHQFTGLKDKKAQDVYEGYYVEAKNFTPQRYLVEFIEGGFCLTHPKLNGYPMDINLMYPSTGCQFEVIGNSYEQPNLLSGGN